MIAMHRMLSTSPARAWLSRRRALLAGGMAVLAGCVSEATPPGPAIQSPGMDGAAFIARDGARLPFRAWLPAGRIDTVMLALHGFNDSRDAWELPAAEFTAAGIALYAPDQRGFGGAPGRGLWPGVTALVDDAADMAAALRARHPGARLFLMGESMGGAVLMLLATGAYQPGIDGYVLLAPAVWGRARMNLFMRSGLWLVATLVPGMEVSRPPPTIRIRPSDNAEALRRLSTNPLTIKSTRFDTLRGLVDLMDAALAAAPTFRAPGLFLYGARDEIVPGPATRATWSALPAFNASNSRLAFYPDGYHLLMRDLGRAAPTGDAIAWLRDPTRRLPSGADIAAQVWLTKPASG